MEDNGVFLDADVEAPRGVLCLDMVGVVSVDPGIVERRFDLGVMYGFIMDEGGGDAAENDARVVGTGIMLRLCCGGLVGVTVSIPAIVAAALKSVFIGGGESMGEGASLDVTEDAYASDADDDRDDNPEPALRLVLVVEAESFENDEA